MRVGFVDCTAFDVEVATHTTLKSVPATKVGRINPPIERFKFNFILTPEFLRLNNNDKKKGCLSAPCGSGNDYVAKTSTGLINMLTIKERERSHTHSSKIFL